MSEPTAPPSKPWYSSPLCWGSLILALPTLLALGARWWWLLELFTNFPLQYVWLLSPLLIGLLIRKHFRMAALVGICVAWNLFLILPIYFGGNASDRPAQLRLMVANVLTKNEQKNLFLERVEEVNPDLLLVLEVDQKWDDALDALREDYPHGLSIPRNDNFGMALLSKLPLKSVKAVYTGPANVPSIQAFVHVDDDWVAVLGTHPLPPIRRYSQDRNDQLAEISSRLHKTSGPRIVAGDLNVTPWSPHFADFVRISGFHDSRKGFGIQPTWPSNFEWFGIPIDHVLVSEEILVVDRFVAGSIGSDHRPVVVDLAIMKEADRMRPALTASQPHDTNRPSPPDVP